MFAHGETSKNPTMHNCCFLTVPTELTFLLHPLDTCCALNPVLNSLFLPWSADVVSLGRLLGRVLRFVTNEGPPGVGGAVEWLLLRHRR